jgi:hypothetical protein
MPHSIAHRPVKYIRAGFAFRAGGDVRHRRTRSERDVVDIVDGRQPARVELAEDHPLGQAFDTAKIKPSRKLLQSPAHEHVARAEPRVGGLIEAIRA